jgi:hypothetical protein
VGPSSDTAGPFSLAQAVESKYILNCFLTYQTAALPDWAIINRAVRTR